MTAADAAREPLLGGDPVPPTQHVRKDATTSWCGGKLAELESVAYPKQSDCRGCLGALLHFHASRAAEASAQMVKLNYLPRGR